MQYSVVFAQQTKGAWIRAREWSVAFKKVTTRFYGGLIVARDCGQKVVKLLLPAESGLLHCLTLPDSWRMYVEDTTMMRMKKSRRRLTHLAAVNYCFVLGIAPPFVENRADDRRQGLTTLISVFLSFFLSLSLTILALITLYELNSIFRFAFYYTPVPIFLLICCRI